LKAIGILRESAAPAKAIVLGPILIPFPLEI